jgi:hypothetical protein
MRKYTVLLALVGLLLGGCLESKQHLTVKKDGSGTLKVKMLIPSGTIELISNMSGGLMDPEPIAQGMFANKEDILIQAEKAGLDIEFNNFNTKKEKDGIHIDYEIGFTDLRKFLQSEIIEYGLNLSANSEGDFIFSLKEASEKIQNSKLDIQAVEKFKDSSKFIHLDPVARQAILEDFRNFKMEFLITLPNEVKSLGGIFKKKDPYTVYASISGDILEDSSFSQEMGRLTLEPSTITFSSQGLDFGAQGESSRPQEIKALSKIALGSKVKLSLKNGKIVYGTLVQQSQNSVKIDSVGIGLTYYADEISRLEAQP